MKLNTKMLSDLIGLAKNELVSEDEDKNIASEGLHTLFDNQMRLQSSIAQHLVNVHHIGFVAPPSPERVLHSTDINPALKCDDTFSQRVFNKLRHQAMYFACFSGMSSTYADDVVQQAKTILSVETLPALMNDVDLRFSNIEILMKALGKDSIQLSAKHFTLHTEVVQNGSTPYKKITMIYFNPNYAGNNFQITKGMYGYDITYNYLGRVHRFQQNFGDAGGDKVLDLPEDMLIVLDQFIEKLFTEYSGMTDIKTMLAVELAATTTHMQEIVTICMGKFKAEDELTDADKMKAVIYFLTERLRWSTGLVINGRTVVNVRSDSTFLSTDYTRLILQTEINSYTKIGQTVQRCKVDLVVDHRDGTDFIKTVDYEDLNTMIYLYGALDYVEKTLRDLHTTALESTQMNKFGRVY